MDKTAVWNVAVSECNSIDEAEHALEGNEHAFIVAPAYRSLLFQQAHALGASSKLSQGADLRYRGGSSTITISQLSRSLVDYLEETFIPIYGAKVVIFGSGSAALDFAYESCRAGVDQVTILDSDKKIAEENLSTFLESFAKNRMSILDTEQAKLGHLSATRAYDHTDFAYGSLQSTNAVSQADIVVSFLKNKDFKEDSFKCLSSSQIVCDPWGRSPNLTFAANEIGCDLVSSSTFMKYWGTACANLLIEFGNAGVR